MKVFYDRQKAIESYNNKTEIYLNSRCYRHPKSNILCGNWCALFHIEENKDSDNNKSPYVVLNCKSSVRLYIDNIIK